MTRHTATTNSLNQCQHSVRAFQCSRTAAFSSSSNTGFGKADISNHCARQAHFQQVSWNCSSTKCKQQEHGHCSMTGQVRNRCVPWTKDKWQHAVELITRGEPAGFRQQREVGPGPPPWQAWLLGLLGCRINTPRTAEMQTTDVVPGNLKEIFYPSPF